MTAAPRGRRQTVSVRQAMAALVALLVLGALVACGSSPPQPLVGGDPTVAKKPIVPVSAQAVVGHMLGSIADRTIGPFLARIPGQGGVVAWVTPAEGSARRILAVPITAVGEPRGTAKTIANVGVDTTMLVVRPTRGATPGVAIAWTVLTDRGEALYAVVVGDDGVPRGKAVELARTSDDVVWVDIVASDVGSVVVWAEETRGADANVLAASLDVDGKVRGVPARVARGVAGWHALQLPSGVGVSTIVTPKGAKGGALSFQRLDADGHPTGAPVPIVTAPVVSGDVEVVRGGGRLVFAWTDRTTDDPSVVAAALGDDGKVEAPHKAVEARGGAALLGLAAGPAGHRDDVGGAGPAHHRHSARVYCTYWREPRHRGATLLVRDGRSRRARDRRDRRGLRRPRPAPRLRARLAALSRCGDRPDARSHRRAARSRPARALRVRHRPRLDGVGHELRPRRVPRARGLGRLARARAGGRGAIRAST